MQRAMQTYLNLTDMTRTREADEYQPLERVVFMTTARQALVQQLSIRGHWQGGVLFGTASAGALHVRVAAPLGPPPGASHFSRICHTCSAGATVSTPSSDRPSTGTATGSRHLTAKCRTNART